MSDGLSKHLKLHCHCTSFGGLPRACQGTDVHEEEDGNEALKGTAEEEGLEPAHRLLLFLDLIRGLRSQVQWCGSA